MLNDGEGGWCPLIDLVEMHQSDSCQSAGPQALVG